MKIIKILKSGGLLFLLTILTGCPSEEECFAPGGETRVNDLIILSPLLTAYSQGNIITLSINIPATNTYFNDGVAINLFEATKDYEPIFICNPEIFIGNQIEFIKGSPNPILGWSNLIYNSENQTYELEIKITLNKVGNYIQPTDDIIMLQGAKKCNRYTIMTNILSNNPGPSRIEFTVQ